MTDAEKLVEWLGRGGDHLPLCDHFRLGVRCNCGLTEARDLAARVVEEINDATKCEAEAVKGEATYATRVNELTDENATLRQRVEELDEAKIYASECAEQSRARGAELIPLQREVVMLRQRVGELGADWERTEWYFSQDTYSVKLLSDNRWYAWNNKVGRYPTLLKLSGYNTRPEAIDASRTASQYGPNEDIEPAADEEPQP